MNNVCSYFIQEGSIMRYYEDCAWIALKII
jgi:hypothetical protein